MFVFVFRSSRRVLVDEVTKLPPLKDASRDSKVAAWLLWLYSRAAHTWNLPSRVWKRKPRVLGARQRPWQCTCFFTFTFARTCASSQSSETNGAPKRAVTRVQRYARLSRCETIRVSWQVASRALAPVASFHSAPCFRMRAGVNSS